MIEEVEKRRLPQRRLLLYQPLRRPAIESVPGSRKNALVHVITGIEPQKFVRQIAILLTNDPLVLCRARGIRGNQKSQRANLAAVETGKERHGRLLAPVEDIDQLSRQHVSIDGGERRETRCPCSDGQCAGI